MPRAVVTEKILLPSRSRSGLMAFALQAIGVWQQRRKLARLDDTQLRDIGVTRAEALQEAERPLWDVPSTWLR
jgi:uncharacterized protein YjiS (DUF1127 family)